MEMYTEPSQDAQTGHQESRIHFVAPPTAPLGFRLEAFSRKACVTAKFREMGMKLMSNFAKFAVWFAVLGAAQFAGAADPDFNGRWDLIVHNNPGCTVTC